MNATSTITTDYTIDADIAEITRQIGLETTKKVFEKTVGKYADKKNRKKDL